MPFKIMGQILGMIILLGIQLGFLKGLPDTFHFDLIIVSIVFILVLLGFKAALWTSLGIGFILDVYSFLPFGLYMVSLLGTLMIMEFLLHNFFTNRSLYTFLALTFFGTISQMAVFFICGFSMRLLKYDIMFKVITLDFLWIEIFHTVANLIAAAMIFYMINLITNNLKPVFLIKKAKI
jgi:hypothetical protein